ncbi:MAG: serine/threonine-protein kinase [Myxococcota bacterium]
MSDTARKVLGGALAVAFLIAAAVVSSQVGASARARAEAEARAAVEEKVTSAADRVGASKLELETIARSGAQKLRTSLRDVDEAALREAGGPESLAKTIHDILEAEDWWEAFRGSGHSELFLAGRPVGEVPEALRPVLLSLAERAETAGVVSELLALDGVPSVVAATLLDLPTKVPLRLVLVMHRPVDEATVTRHATELGVALALAGASATVAGGIPTARPWLDGFLQQGTKFSTSCCASRDLVAGLRLVVAKDPSSLLGAAEASAGRARIVSFAVALVLAGLGLFLTFRKGGDENEKLLRETAAALVAQREELQRLSQQISNPNIALNPNASPAVTGASDPALAATSASVAQSRYEELAPLGQGGMAKVFVAMVRGAEGFRRLFVVKRLRPELAGTEELVNQFIDEARLGASLVHSNVVPVLDFGRDADGYYMALEYILGRDVDAVVQASMKKRGRALEVPVVLGIAQEALKALSYAHTKTDESGKWLGLVHRDVSPNNLMMTARGEVKLLDFGIVKGEHRLTKTQTGVVKGNLFFMSPEQAKGLPLDGRSDLFSLGLVLFYAATGETLYTGSTNFELLTRAAQGVLEVDLARLKALPEPLSSLLQKALKEDPAQRYADAEDFARAIAATGQVATAAELKQVMELLLKDELAEEQARFAPREGA